MKDETQIPPHNGQGCQIIRVIIFALRQQGKISYGEFETMCALLTIAGIDMSVIGEILMGMHMVKWIKMIGEGDEKEQKTMLPGPNIPTGDLDELHIFHLTDELKKLQGETELQP